MIQSVHGRSVLKLIAESDSSLSRAELMQAMESEFGADSEFHTCSAKGLSGEQLLTLFLGKGKLVETEGKITAEACKTCSHH